MNYDAIDGQSHQALPIYIAPKLIVIPKGEFLMGSTDGAANERPVHKVWLDAFEIAQYPVTNREYALFLKASTHSAPPFWHDTKFSHPQQPVVGTTWFDAQAYCQWLSELTGKHYRLPTEAEREKAARGGLSACTYPWGDELPDDHKGSRNGQLEPVGNDGANGYGLYNMAGGVHEWCSDWHNADYYQVSPYKNPQGPEQGQRKVSRGGAWRHAIRFSRCAARSSVHPITQYNDFGFRCAASIF